MTNDQTNHQTNKKKGISVRWKLLWYMTGFVVVVLLITWFFQIFMLDDFFRTVKRNEMSETAKSLEESLLSDDLSEIVRKSAVDHSLYITVYRIEKNAAKEIVHADDTGNTVPIRLSQERLQSFYNKAKKNGGAFYSRLAFGHLEIPDEDLLDMFPFGSDTEETQKIPDKSMRLIYVSISHDVNGEEYLIFLDSSLQPLSSTVRTLSLQYIWIMIIILVAAVVMALILYRKISAPLIRMNTAAKSLSVGKYDVDFAGYGYRETRELADTLNYAAHELSRTDHLQKELIANISHDLRTPLTLIKGYSEVMRDFPEEITTENMQVLIDETTHLSDLVNDLLDLSRIQTGARVLKSERFDITASTREVCSRYDALLKHRGFTIGFQSDSPVCVCADHSMILQVLYNLINNAVNFSGSDQRVTLSQVRVGTRVRISVTDTGDGIKPEDLPLIWDRYYKVDKIHKRAMIGTGLGLSIVKEILELHHAVYGVDSTIGVGSTFWFELPIVDPPDNDIQNGELT